MSPALKNILYIYHKRWCAELGIKPTTVHYVKPTEPQPGGGYYRHDDNSITIFIHDMCDYEYYKWLMAHETYHHYQNQTKQLSIRKYKGQNKSKWPKYSKRPWERAANRFAKKVCYQLSQD